ncbi:hypothetical protein FA95DRAFT_1497894 [Auriscalpium vulgare]|uniref:Uncharacterized protein n=1 Tax=Auriscalpium vulgare TaxID=40419 RepID=A0ACB8RJN0_9AGAM|nr:hypothetical protein FA95DRAFT_1497894 [Auriscalpium vulgare]
MPYGIVNGEQGIVRDVIFDVDEHGDRVARCAYIEVTGCRLQCEGAPVGVVPIFPSTRSFAYTLPGTAQRFSISRQQLPLLPAYCYTDYKSQGRSLETVIVDIAGCRSLQSAYVMLSRVKSLKGLAILRGFPPNKISMPLTHEFRDEFARLASLAASTKQRYLQSTQEASAEVL